MNMLYIRCRTCGKYMTRQSAIKERYCSEHCSKIFSTCENCGSYFESGTGVRQHYCSEDCATNYTVSRSFGPEPVNVTTEE